MFEVNVSPDMNMYSLLISQGYDPTYALCEFLDNSIHAFQEHSNLDVLEIDVDFFSPSYHIKDMQNSIFIRDKGPGIEKTTLKKALQPAKKTAKPGLSEFGIGMKAAAVWFTNEWILTTQPIGQGKKLSTSFNLEKLLAEGKSVVEVSEEPCNTSEHGTTIRLQELRNNINREKYEKIRAGIGDIYQKFINRDNKKVKINTSFDGEKSIVESTYKGFETLIAAKFIKQKNEIYTDGQEREWKINIDTTFQGSPVTGFIHLMKNGGYNKNPGLILFRHNRVIVGTTEKHYKPEGLYGTSNKAAGMRLQGELHLNKHKVSYTKDRFSFEDKEFSQHLINNVTGLSDLLNQAENYRVKGAKSLNHQTTEPPKTTNPTNTDVTVKNNGIGHEPSNSSIAQQEPPKYDNAHNTNQFQPQLPQFQPQPQPQVQSTKNNTDEKSSFNSGNSPKPETRIKLSENISQALHKASASKLSHLYSSLCRISLVEHPILTYVGAWTFFEVLSRKCGNTGDDFPAFFTGKVQQWGFTKEDKKSFNNILKSISDRGNIIKHHQDAMQVSATQLANDFMVLERLIISALQHIQSFSKEC